MDEIEYFDLLEQNQIARGINTAVQAIFGEYFGVDHGRTMADLQRIAYKYTDAGVAVGFRLFDGSYIWKGDSRASDLALVNAIEDICIGSIVEGSDIDVDTVWLDLLKIADGTDKACELYPGHTIEKLAVCRWYEKLDEVEKAAAVLWQESRGDLES